MRFRLALGYCVEDLLFFPGQAAISLGGEIISKRDFDRQAEQGSRNAAWASGCSWSRTTRRFARSPHWGSEGRV